MELLKGRLRRLEGRCMSCRRGGLAGAYLLVRCHEEESKRARMVYWALRDKVREGRKMDRFSECVRCFVPFEWCNR